MSLTRAIRKNLVTSFLLGPVRGAVPAILMLVLFRMLADHGGLALIGKWGMLSLVIETMALLALGLPDWLARQVASGDSPSQALRLKMRMMAGAILVLGFGIGAGLYEFHGPVAGAFDVTREDPFAVAFPVAAAAGCAVLVSRLVEAQLIGSHRYYFVQSLEMLETIVQFCLAVAVLWAVEAGATVIAQLAWCMLAARLCRLAVALGLSFLFTRESAFLLPAVPVPARMVDMALGAQGFIALAAGQRINQLVLKYVIGVGGGAEALGLWNVAIRIPGLLHALFGGGLKALLPSLSALSSAQRGDMIPRVMRSGLAAVTLVNVPALSAFIMLAVPLLFLWLPDQAAKVLPVAMILTLATMLQSLSLPVMWGLQGLHHERAAALSVWTRVGVLAIALPLLAGGGVGAQAVALVHFASVVIGMVPMLWVAEGRMGLISRAMPGTELMRPAVVIMAMLAVAVLFRVETQNIIAAPFDALLAVVVMGVAWAGGLMVMTQGRPLIWAREFVLIRKSGGSDTSGEDGMREASP